MLNDVADGYSFFWHVGLREETQMIRSWNSAWLSRLLWECSLRQRSSRQKYSTLKKKTFNLVAALALALIVFLFLFLICQSDRQFDPTYTNRNIVHGCLLGTFLLLLMD